MHTCTTTRTKKKKLGLFIIITILCLGLSSNCFVIRNLVTVIFQAKEKRPRVLNEKSSDQVPQRAHKKCQYTFEFTAIKC